MRIRRLAWVSSTVLAMGLFMSPTGESVAWAQEPTEEEAAAEGAAEEAAEESEEAGEAAAEEAGDEAAEAEAEAAEKAKMEAEKAKMEAEKAKKAAEKAKMEAEEAKMEAKKEAAAAEAAAAEATAEAAPVEGPAEEGEVEELMVTGSRIRRKDLSTPAPVAVIDTQTINNSGLITIGQILQNLPAQSNAINIQFNNGGDGSTRVNLRGLGAPRTLVLLNGRRVVPGGTGANASVDLNMVPIEIIERVEVLKDGASAVYGSDAIGGVVNIITKKDFSGVEAGTYFGAGQHGAEQFQASITAGETTDRSAFLMSFQYFRQEPMYAGARDFSKSDLAFDWPSGDESTLGSSAPPEGLIIAGGGGGNDAWNELTANNDFVYFNDPEDGWRTAQLTGNSDVGEGDFYNYQPENYLVTPAERYSIFGQGHYDLTDKVKLYAEALYSNRRSDQLLAPTPLFTAFTANGLVASADSVYNPFGVDIGDVRRRMVEASNRLFTQDIDTYRIVLGLEGDFPDDLGVFSTWKWDFNFNFGRTQATSTNEGQFIASRVQNAIGPSFYDAGGVARCGTPGNVIIGCVPLNLFGGAGTITQDMLNYISFTGTDRGYSEQRLFSFETGGEIFELNNRPASIALGMQQRRESGGDLPDPITQIGDSTGNNRTPTDGAYNELAFYAELYVPLLADLPGVELFELTAAARVFDFDTFGTDFMWKVGGLWKIYSDVSVRATFSRAFRAPNVGELFQGATDSFPGVTDPCDSNLGRTPDAQRNCAADGIPDTLVTGQTQLRTIIGGNPELNPETANVLTAGVVWEPKVIPSLKGLSFTVDYFNISIDNSIQPVGASVILNNCYQKGPDEERTNCDQITRNANNIITQLNDLQQNTGGVDTSGIDFALRYTRGTSVGRFGASFDATWINAYDEEQPDGTIISGVNQYDLTGTGGMFPSWRFNVTVQWAKDGLGAGTNFRYIRPIRECEDNGCDPGSLTRQIDANLTADLFASYAFSTSAGYTSIRAGINNITDQAPPKIYNGFLANSDAANYDYLGRYFYIGLNHKL